MNPTCTIAAAITTGAALTIAGCGKSAGESPPAPSAPKVATAPASSPSSRTSPQHPGHPIAAPSVPTSKAAKPSRAGGPRKVRRRDVEDLAERFTKAWTTLELGEGDPRARRELAKTITPQFAAELARMKLPPREDPAELKDIDVIQHAGGGRRWTAVVRLMRHGSTEYLQAEIARRHGRLVVSGMSW